MIKTYRLLSFPGSSKCTCHWLMSHPIKSLKFVCLLGRQTLSNKPVSNSLPSTVKKSVCPLMRLFTLASPSLFPLNKRRFKETFHLSVCWKLQDSGLWGNLQTMHLLIHFLPFFFLFLFFFLCFLHS